MPTNLNLPCLQQEHFRDDPPSLVNRVPTSGAEKRNVNEFSTF